MTYIAVNVELFRLKRVDANDASRVAICMREKTQ